MSECKVYLVVGLVEFGQMVIKEFFKASFFPSFFFQGKSCHFYSYFASCILCLYLVVYTRISNKWYWSQVWSTYSGKIPSHEVY